MKKILLVSLMAMTAFMAVGCKKSSSDSEDDGKIQVNYYLDYNQITAGEIYYSYRVENNSKLQEPDRPTEGKFPEFPIFKGWSKKEVIDNMDELWNFSTDVMKVKEGIKTFNLFGIWVAQGE